MKDVEIVNKIQENIVKNRAIREEIIFLMKEAEHLEQYLKENKRLLDEKNEKLNVLICEFDKFGSEMNKFYENEKRK